MTYSDGLKPPVGVVCFCWNCGITKLGFWRVDWPGICGILTAINGNPISVKKYKTHQNLMMFDEYFVSTRNSNA